MKNQYFGRERICASLIENKLKGKTLNLGAGEMLWIENDLFLNNQRLISSDIDPKNLGPQNLCKNKILVDATSIPFKDGNFQQVIILDVLEHIKNHERAVEEIYRILNRNGRLVICVPNDTLLSFLNPIRYAQHERHYAIKRITSLLKNKRFKIEKVFAGGGIWELCDLYTHLFLKYALGIKKNLAAFNKLRDREYAKHSPSGNEIAILARKP